MTKTRFALPEDRSKVLMLVKTNSGEERQVFGTFRKWGVFSVFYWVDGDTFDFDDDTVFSRQEDGSYRNQRGWKLIHWAYGEELQDE